MAENNRIDIQIVGTADFKSVYSEMQKLRAQIAAVSAQSSSMGKMQINVSGLKEAEKTFLSTVGAIKGVNVKMVELAQGSAHLNDRLLNNKRTFGEMFSTWRAGSKNMTEDMKRIGDYNAKLHQSMVVPSAVRNGQAAVITNFGATADSVLKAHKTMQAYNLEMRNLGNSMVNWGKNTQWAGRQLTVGFTVPLLAAGGAISAMFLKVDEAMRKLVSVYGVGGQSGQKFSNIVPTPAELEQVRTGVMQVAQEMAKLYGQSADATVAVAADLAAAGYTQQQLLDLTKTASDAMVLGQTDQQSAVKATIAIQNAYRLSTQQTGDALKFFSAAQAATSTNMKDLIDAVPRVGPIIKNLGGTYKDTVAMIVAMKEGGVAAGEGANAIKNSIQRIVSPTDSARKALAGFNINLNQIAQSGSPVVMIEKLQDALSKLNPVEKQQAITELFGKFQAARMTALLDNFNRSGTQSAKVMQMMGLTSKELTDIQARQAKALTDSPSMKFQSAIQALKTQLLPVGQKLIELVTPLINGITWIVKVLDKIGPVKYLLAGGLGFTALLGPIIMFGGLISNLVGQMFKLSQQGRMFREGFMSGGGLTRPFTALKEGIKSTQAYLEAFDAAEYASKAVVDEMTLSADKQKNSFLELTKAMEQYRQELERIRQTGGGLPPAGPPMGGMPGAYPRVPTGGPSSPYSIIGEATRPLQPQVLNLEIAPGRGGLAIDGAKGIVFSHMRPDEMTRYGSNILNIPGYEKSRNAMGGLGVVPGYMTPLGGFGAQYNEKLGSQALPIVPPSMMSEANVRSLLAQSGYDPKQITQRMIREFSENLSLESIAAVESGKLAQLRGLSMLQNNPAAMAQFRGLGKSGATGADIEGFFAAQIPEWENMKRQASQDVIMMYETAQREAEVALKSGTATATTMQQRLSLTGGRFSEILSEHYMQIVNSYEQGLVQALTVDSTDAGVIREQMKRKTLPGLINAGASAEKIAVVLVESVQNLINQAQMAMAQTTERINLAATQLSGEGITTMGRGRTVPRGALPIPRAMFASGGKVSGPGGPKDDKIPALLSNGEYVVKADAVGHYGSGFMDAINTRKLASGGIVHLKGGGVSNPYATTFAHMQPNINLTARQLNDLHSVILKTGTPKQIAAMELARAQEWQGFRAVGNLGLNLSKYINVGLNGSGVKASTILADLNERLLYGKNPYSTMLVRIGIPKENISELSKKMHSSIVKKLESMGPRIVKDADLYKMVPKIVENILIENGFAGNVKNLYAIESIRTGRNPGRNDIPDSGTQIRMFKRLSEFGDLPLSLRQFARRAYGGPINGPGGPRDDIIPAYLSNGEYVVNADSVKHYGSGFMDAVNAKKFASGGIARFADGGHILSGTGEYQLTGGYSKEALEAISSGAGRNFMTEAELEAFLKSPESPYYGKNVDEFFASRRAGEIGLHSGDYRKGWKNLGLKMREETFAEWETGTSWDKVKRSKVPLSAEEAKLAGLAYTHAMGAKKIALEMTPEEVDAGARRLREHLSKDGATHIRVYRSLVMTPQNADAAPGHFGVMSGSLSEAESGQRYVSFSQSMRIPKNFTKHGAHGQTPRIVEVDVPIDAVVAIDRMNYDTTAGEGPGYKEQEVIVDTAKLKNIPIRYVTPTGLSEYGEEKTTGLLKKTEIREQELKPVDIKPNSMASGAKTASSEAEFLSTIAPRANSEQAKEKVFADIHDRAYQDVDALGGEERVKWISRLAEANVATNLGDSERLAEINKALYGVTHDEMSFAERRLLELSGKTSINEINANDFSNPKHVRVLDLVKAYKGLAPRTGYQFNITETPGVTSNIWSPIKTTGNVGMDILARRFMPRPVATGGLMSGSGTATSDSIPAMLSNGEYVVNANSVKHYGSGFMDAINTKKLAGGGGVGRFAGGSESYRGAYDAQRSMAQTQQMVKEIVKSPAAQTLKILPNTMDKVNNSFKSVGTAFKETGSMWKNTTALMSANSLNSSKLWMAEAKARVTESIAARREARMNRSLYAGQVGLSSGFPAPNPATRVNLPPPGERSPGLLSGFKNWMTNDREGKGSRIGAGFKPGMGSMMGGMGLSMAGSMMGSKMAESAGGETGASQALTYGGTGAMLGSMFGPYGLIAGGVIGAGLGFAMGSNAESQRKLEIAMNNSHQAAVGLTTAMSGNQEVMQQLGLRAKSINDLKLFDVTTQTDAFKESVNQLADAMANGSEQSKQMVTYIKNANPDDQRKALAQQFYVALQQGGNLEEAQAAAAATAQAAGLGSFMASSMINSLVEEAKRSTSTVGKGGVRGEPGSALSLAAWAYQQQGKKQGTVEDIKDFAEKNKILSSTIPEINEKVLIETSKALFGVEVGRNRVSYEKLDLNEVKRAYEDAFINNKKEVTVGGKTFSTEEFKRLIYQSPYKGAAETASQFQRGTLGRFGLDKITLPEGFNISSLSTQNGKNGLEEIVKQTEGMSGKDLLTATDPAVLAIAKMAEATGYLNKEMEGDEATKAINKFKESVADVGTEVYTSLQKWQDLGTQLDSQVTQPLSNAIMTLKGSEFSTALTSMTENLSDYNLAEVYKKITSGLSDEVKAIAPSADASRSALMNFLQTLNAIRNLPNITASQIDFIQKDTSGRARQAAELQSISYEAFNKAGTEFQSAVTGQTDAEAKAEAASETQKRAAKEQKALSKEFKMDQRAAQDAFKEQQKAENEKIKGIQKEIDARQKLYDAKQKQIQQDQTLFGLANKISAARNSGDLLALAAAQNEYNNELNRQNIEAAKAKADESDQNKIKKIQDRMEAEQEAFDKKMQAMQDSYDAKMESLQNQVDAAQEAADKAAKAARDNQNDDEVQRKARETQSAWQTVYDWMQDPKHQEQMKGKTIEELFLGAQKGTLGAENDTLKTALSTLENNTGMSLEKIAAKSKDTFTTTAKWVETNIKFAVDGSGAITRISMGDGKRTAQLKIDPNGNIILDYNTSTAQGAVLDFAPPVPFTSNVKPAVFAQGAKLATGGPVRGPGTETSDSIPAMLSDGEYVVKAKSVKKYGTGFLDAVNAGHFASGGLVKGYAEGGGVSGPNHWPHTSQNMATGSIPGTNARITMRREVLPLFRALAKDYNDNIATIKGSQTAGYDPRTDRPAKERMASNHPSGTALDINWNSEGQHSDDKSLYDWWAIGKKGKSTNWDYKSSPPYITAQRIKNKYRIVDWFGPRSLGGYISNKKNWDYMHWQITQSRYVGPQEVAATERALGITSNFGPGSPLASYPYSAGTNIDSTSTTMPYQFSQKDLTPKLRSALLQGLNFGWPNMGNSLFKLPMNVGKTNSNQNPNMASIGSGAGGIWLKNFLASKGISGGVARTLWAIAMRESSGDPSVLYPGGRNYNWNSSESPHYDVGLFQINNRHLDLVKRLLGNDKNMREMLNPDSNFTLMRNLSRNFTSWNAWGIGRDGTSADWSGWPSTTWSKDDSFRQYMNYRNQYDTISAARGGLITGPGGPKDDMIPARLSNGEFVMSAAAVNKYGIDVMKLINSGALDPRFSAPAKINSRVNPSDTRALYGSSNSNVEYNINVSVAGSNASPDEIANAVMRTLKQREKANMTHRTIG